MADAGATLFARQSAGDLLGRPSHRKAGLHQIAQVRLAFQLETTIPSPPPLGQILRPHRFVTARPGLGPDAVAPQLTTDRRWRPAPTARYRPSRYTACMQAGYPDPLPKSGRAINSSQTGRA